MKYIYIPTFAVVIACLLFLHTNIPYTALFDADASFTNIGVRSIDEKLSRENVLVAKITVENEDSADIVSAPVVSTVARYDGSNHAWTFFGKIKEIKDVSIYGRPGTIAQVEFMREGERQFAWTVIQIDDYYFVEGNRTLTSGQEVLLEVSGEHVSAKGVNWETCARNDKYCEYASFIEGGFPVSEDYAGLTICPSNQLIYSGYTADDWINGMLAWKIKIHA